MAKALRRLLPLVISLALVAWLLWHVQPNNLMTALGELNWGRLLPVTAILVLALYGWEALCFRELFGLPERPLTYGQMLRVRGASYLAGVINYEAGQALAAWHIARLQQTSLLSTLSRTVLLAYHDVFVLFALASVGTLLSGAEEVRKLRPFCLIGFALLVVLGVAGANLPHRWRQKLRSSRWGAWSSSWSWLRSARLTGLRTVYMLILVGYGAVASRICDVPLDLSSALGIIPLVQLADALPSASGLGTRDNALKYLLDPERPAVVAAMSLVWSSGMLIGRLLIGLVNLWWHGGSDLFGDEESAASDAVGMSRNQLVSPSQEGSSPEVSSHTDSSNEASPAESSSRAHSDA